MLTLINISGEDRPGLTAKIAAMLSKFDAVILDVGQAVIHDHLSLGLLVSLPENADHLEHQIKQLGVGVKFGSVDVASYENWVGVQGAGRHILTLLARRISASHLADVSEIISDSGLNIDNITRLSGRVPISDRATEKASPSKPAGLLRYLQELVGSS